MPPAARRCCFGVPVSVPIETALRMARGCFVACDGERDLEGDVEFVGERERERERERDVR